jgi:hypothetical protein
MALFMSDPEPKFPKETSMPVSFFMVILHEEAAVITLWE